MVHLTSVFRGRLGRLSFVCAVVLSLQGSAAAAVTSNGEYVVGALPFAPTTDVAFGGTSLFAGSGAFGVGTESIVRIDADGTVTVLVTNLNSIGGIAFDSAGDRLLFTDNGLDAPPGGATTGDTVYALPSPRTVASSVPADGLALVPDGTIPFAQGVLPLPSGVVLVGDSVGAGLGRVVSVSGGVASDLVTGLDFAAGLALDATGTELLVGDVDAVTFAGSVESFDLSGAPLGTFASGLSGAFDQVLDHTGNLLVTGGFTGDFSSSTVVRLDGVNPAGEVATGFGFSAGIDVDTPSGQVAVVDFGASQIDTLTPIDRMTPGGRGKKECHVELWGQDPDRSRSGRPRNRWTCDDGDPACDRDLAVDGKCTYAIGACFGLTDPRAEKCTPLEADSAEVALRPKVAGSDAFPALQAAVDDVLPVTGAGCSALVPIEVAAGGKKKILVTASAAGSKLDRDRVTLKCKTP